MKALLLDGSESAGGAEEKICGILSGMLEDGGWEAATAAIREMKIAYCMGDFGCWVKTPGTCLIKDGGVDVEKIAARADLLVMVSPISFGGYSSQFKRAMDRLIPNLSPFFGKFHGETHHARRYDSYPRMIGIGVLDQLDDESERIFKTLISRNALNFHSPGHSAAVIRSDADQVATRKLLFELLAEAGVEI